MSSTDAGDSISLDEARRLLDSGEAVLVDVREPHEWDAGHAPQARHVPLADLDPGQLPAGTQVITTCRSGGRGSRAAQALSGAGLPARNLDGGMRGWHDAGLPLRRADGTAGTVE
ncbi:MAG: rhodanese-like domain-containing protein [Pseudonocardiaceae bacterium]|nr:rhodanese-like domain-containing protein [Pseudonocardiaceae bacterium]